jgi:hypothetical protein
VTLKADRKNLCVVVRRQDLAMLLRQRQRRWDPRKRAAASDGQEVRPPAAFARAQRPLPQRARDTHRIMLDDVPAIREAEGVPR